NPSTPWPEPPQPKLRSINRIRAGHDTRPSPSEVPRRDDGSGQAAIREVGSQPRFRRLADRLLSCTPLGDGHRADPVQKQVPGKWTTQKKGLTNQGPLQKPGWSTREIRGPPASRRPGLRCAPSGLPECICACSLDFRAISPETAVSRPRGLVWRAFGKSG